MLVVTDRFTWLDTTAVSKLSHNGPRIGKSLTSFSAGISRRSAFSRQSPARGKFVMLTHSSAFGQRPKILITRPVLCACELPTLLPTSTCLAPSCTVCFLLAASDLVPPPAHEANAASTVSLTTPCAEAHHLSATHLAAGSNSCGASRTPGSTASSSKACGPHRSQNAAASVRNSSSHVGSAAHLPRAPTSSPKSPCALASLPLPSSFMKRPPWSCSCRKRQS
mmetsp:Transcript_86821/g.202055  ORF Transcript_86821/g.202055 Transcript_86821/m.202055 type:complete len:223 (+) Transcript_86821:391-1059(+)